MAAETGISWTDSTWSPLLGCSPASAGCARCYALRDVWRMAHNPNRKISTPRQGLVEKTSGRLRWTGKISLVPEQLPVPLRWRKGRRIFVANQSDLFHPDVPDQFIAAVFGVMAAAKHHTFQLLTKRPERARQWFERNLEVCGPAVTYLRAQGFETGCGSAFDPDEWPLPNVWIGTSVENQAAAEERVPQLLKVPAAVRFLSCEPLLGPVNLDLPRCETHDREFVGTDGTTCTECAADGWSGELSYGHWLNLNGGIDWVIAGGESGQLARPCEEAWVRSIVEQCKADGTACFVKQLGTVWARSPRTHEAFFLGGGHQAGADPEEWPTDLRVQQMPEVPRG